ncbi:MAG: PilC/PilY family type IV pilus protein [Thermoanaerobaculia bacterium]
MSRQLLRHSRRSLLAAVLSFALGTLLWTPSRPAWSDDRDLLRQSAGNPYVFVILDTSGSMNEVAQTSIDALAAGDDSTSKLYGAKQALYQVMTQFTNISYGFATFNQDGLRVFRKHWIYQANADPSWSATLAYPVKAQSYVFGGGVSSNTQFGCNTSPAPLSLPASAASVRQLVGYPRTGDLGDQTHGIWLKQTGRTYYVETQLTNGSKLGDATISVNLRRRRLATGVTATKCGATPPSTSTFDETIGFSVVTYTLVTDAVLNTLYDTVSPATQILPNNDKTAAATCGSGSTPPLIGYDPNTDTAADGYTITSATPNVPVNLKYPTASNPSFTGNARFDEGDFLPLNWTKDNRDEVIDRLAPNLRLGETTPDFKVARYFQNAVTGNTAQNSYGLQLLSTTVHPLIGEGFTPLGNTLQSFRTWYSGCSTGPCTSGWASIAAANDPNWACRKKYVIILTDGDETCNNAKGASDAAMALHDSDGVTTFVIAFGVASTSVNCATQCPPAVNSNTNALNCMACKGGSGAPVYPQDESALVTELQKIFGAIQEDNRAFASAAVPAVETDVEDKIYLSNFTPIDQKGYWDGHLDAYLRPLPVTSNGLPNKTLACSSTLTSGCHLWDAGQKILDLAPSTSDLSAATPNFQIGGGNHQRRVYYTQAQATATVPMVTKLLLPQAATADKVDLYAGLNLSPLPVTSDATADAKVINILKATYKTKTDTITDSLGNTSTITFLLDDIFHSNPLVLSSPSRSIYYNANLNTKGQTCTSGDPGYKCFALKHEFRRKMLAVGDNDQQLHIFDAGLYDTTTTPPAFGNGTGYEIYSLVPRPLLPNLQTLSTDTTQMWGVDGTPQADDVFIDPSHNGTPTESDREWRTVVVGGFREGGSGYVAVDVTQPDILDSNRVPQPTSTWVPSCWNGGSGCGTVSFGSVLWTFTDTSDADGNGHADLGQTWSSPALGRILVKTTDSPPQLQDRYVAIFGGGMDPNNLNQQGNYLYMVDMETGKAIYKRQLDGSTPSDPAAVDTDQDGYIDTIYIGTTAGSLYKVDIRAAGTIVQDSTTHNWTITDTAWDPFRVFDTLQSDTGKRGPIFFPPSVVFVAQRGKYSLAFGTGDRWNLWSQGGAPGRLYVILDTGFAKGMTPTDESQYQDVTSFSAAPAGSNFLINPQGSLLPGWFLKLATQERMITKPFTLAGLSVFTSFDPTITVSGAVCAKSGTSNIFTVYTTTGDPTCPTGALCSVSDPPTPECYSGRCKPIVGVATNPFVEPSATKNPCDPTKDPNCTPTPLCSNLSNVTKTLMGLFPSNCQFANFTQDIKTVEDNGNIVCIAPVPVCVIRKNWKEN